jgi:hypothetical protein
MIWRPPIFYPRSRRDFKRPAPQAFLCARTSRRDVKLQWVSYGQFALAIRPSKAARRSRGPSFANRWRSIKSQLLAGRYLADRRTWPTEGSLLAHNACLIRGVSLTEAGWLKKAGRLSDAGQPNLGSRPNENS